MIELPPLTKDDLDTYLMINTGKKAAEPLQLDTKYNNTSSHDFVAPCGIASWADEQRHNFYADLVYGQEGERYCNEFIKKHADDPRIHEAKRDKRAIGTGNLAIEYESRKEPSGIMVTKAEWWWFVVDDLYPIPLPVPFLKWYHANVESDLTGVRGGDKDPRTGIGTSRLTLLPLNRLHEFLVKFRAYTESKKPCN